MDIKSSNIQLDSRNSFAIYRLPFEDDIILIHQNGQANQFQPNDYNAEGFVIHPFQINNHPSYFIKAQRKYKNPIWSFKLKSSGTLGVSSKMEYINKINTAINSIGRGMSKVVLSRVKSIRRSSKNLSIIYADMCRKYPNAFCYLAYTPEIGCWMGATPEQLLAETQHNTFTTMSLAGTRKVQDTPLSKEWSNKDSEEQKIVTDYIRTQLSLANFNFREWPVKTLKIGPLEHLYTKFEIESTDVENLVKKLHPTPAVCGSPKAQAAIYITKNEGYDRKYYTGYIGPVSQKSSSMFFVNLRCMQIFSNTANIYVGGGITGSSVAQQEWEETELKAKMLLNIL